ncbi:MAG: hypothetical protein M3Y54_13940 [Bacteroidota bacterium]|nr:hypothetical protein [Bacteroidota bacterium]
MLNELNMLGSLSMVSETQNETHNRKLTAKMMKALHQNLGISAEVLLAAV